MKYLAPYAVTLVLFVAIDLVWLMWLARPTYVAEMGSLLRKEPHLIAAIAFYLLYAAGLVIFAVSPGLKADSAMHAMVMGACLGLIAYGTYDLTNLAVLNGYSARIALIDMAWGLALSGATAALAVAICRKLI
jgi:uncharacterized membrane protein